MRNSHSPAFGLTTEQIIWHQWRALLRKGGMLNLACRPAFFLIWGILCYTLAQHTGLHALWLPACMNLWIATRLYQRYRLIIDTATSAVSSGARGYLELEGQVVLPDTAHYPCIANLPVAAWLPGYVEDEPFYLADGTGYCLLYPKQAEVVVRPANTPLYWLYAIYPGQTLYVIGHMQTHGTENNSTTYRTQVQQLLAQWKLNPSALLAHYDKNKNNRLDPEEWEQVVNNAKRLITEELNGSSCQAIKQISHVSGLGHLFLITNIPPEALANRYRISSVLHTLLWLSLLLICML